MRRWTKDRRGTAYMILLPFLVAGALLMALGASTIQSAAEAHQAMSRYEQIALQQVADSAVALSTRGTEWTNTTTTSHTAVATAFTTALQQALAGTPFAHLAITVTAVDIYTPNNIGEPAPPGYPASTITAPGYYADVQFPWPLAIPGHPTLTLKVPEVMQANSFSAPNTTWNPNP